MNFNKIKKSALLVDDKQSDDIKNVFKIVYKTFKILQKIDTQDVKPSDFPYELQKDFLRDDVVGKTFPQEFKKNIDVNKENFVVLKGEQNE